MWILAIQIAHFAIVRLCISNKLHYLSLLDTELRNSISTKEKLKSIEEQNKIHPP